MAVYKRGGRYWIDFYFGVDENGKPKRFRIPSSENHKEAKAALDRIRGRISSGDFRPAELDPPAPETKSEGEDFAHALKLYREHRDAQGRSAQSYEMLARYWLPLFGERPLRSITSEEIETALLTWKEARTWSPATRNQALAQLSGLLSWCYGRKFLDAHPTEKNRVPRLAVDNAKTRWLRPGEIEALVNGAVTLSTDAETVTDGATRAWLATVFPAVVRFACSTGMRLGEVCDLRVGSFQKDTKERAFVVTGVTKNGTRLAWPMEGATLTLVEAAIKRTGEKFPASYLFAGPHGGNAETSIKRYLPAVCKLAKIPYGRKLANGTTFHTFRHSMASLALNAGVPEVVVAKMGNWKDRRMLARYAHLSDDTMRDAAGKLAALVTGAAPSRSHAVVTTDADTPTPSPAIAEEAAAS
jgi:integrase